MFTVGVVNPAKGRVMGVHRWVAVVDRLNVMTFDPLFVMVAPTTAITPVVSSHNCREMSSLKSSMELSNWNEYWLTKACLLVFARSIKAVVILMVFAARVRFCSPWTPDCAEAVG